MSSSSPVLRPPWLPYVGPFAIFVLFLALGDKLGLGAWEFPFRVLALTLSLWFLSRHVIDLRAPNWLSSSLVGIGVFVIWVAPDVLWPTYRQHWLFQNSIMGTITSSLPEGFHMDPMVLVFRSIRAIILVPIIEELFWRAWLMRWLINPDFEKIPLGAYQASSFVVTALLFASEHGPYWEVGLVAGIIYNAWMIRTRSLGDCILAHAVTNAALSAYVVFCGKWEYWL
ncbi:MAG: CAAX prenyl protease-related protein [Acidimicrobiia bacterium]|nr:CAAX prenyl protease-related protein [Acidimicrobiia bacterium]